MRKKFMFSVMALILCLNLAIAQTFQVSGKVTDENGSPLGSVSITEKGKKSGTTTDLKALYLYFLLLDSTARKWWQVPQILTSPYHRAFEDYQRLW
jgi:hypothetical protein